MEYKVEEISPVERKINVTVPAEEATAAVSAATAMYRMRTDIKGFRKGKAPASMIESRFHKQIYGEATTDLINLHINQILGEVGMQPLSRIDVDHDLIKRDEDFEYSISFEVAPKVELPNLDGLKVEEEKAVVQPEELEKVEERVIDNAAEVKVLEDARQPKDGEVATVSFAAYQGDKVIDGIKAENFDLPLGEGQALPEFEELVKTLSPGEDGEKEVTFPADFINENLAGQTVLMKVKLHAVKERVRPEMSDEVAKKAGFESVEKMREIIEKSYLDSRKQLAKSKAQQDLLKQAMDGVDFPLPPSMVEDRIDRLVKDTEYKLDRQGKSLASLGKPMEQVREELREEAEQTVRSEIFLLAVASEEGLEVTREEIDATLGQLAMQNQMPLHELKKYYEDNNLIMPLKDRIMCDKAMESIYDRAEVTEVEPAAAEGEKKAPAKKAPAKKAAAKKTTKKAADKEEGEKKAPAKKPAAKKAPAKKAADKEDGEKKAPAKKPAAKKTTKKTADEAEKKAPAKKPAAKKAPAKKAAAKKDEEK
ncbi:trigger factor [Salidesulfovibrio brasiliensis]